MRVCLLGADHEENLGLGMVAAAAEAAGHDVEVLPFNDPRQMETLARRAADADVVGLSIQFQHRAREFLILARRLRQVGFSGHLTCGGQFPTMAWRDVLEGRWGVDSVVLHEGERSFVELLAALSGGRPLSSVAGLALPQSGRTAPRRLEDDLDRLPFARRYRSHSRHVGIPFIPVMGSRGCWGRCSYCSITTLYRDARQHGGARLMRHRSPHNIAEEMALLSHGAGGPAVFCFHDDNFLMPRPADSLRRIQAIRQCLDEFGVGPVGLVGKCRPDSLTPELARQLRALGVVRLYVGVENVSQAGSDHLNRRVQVAQVDRALEACREAGIFGCYNLLLFEPDATLQDVAQNVRFIREHASHPVNFCRVEPYCGTPLQRRLAREQNLSGNFLGYDYRIHDDQVELLFRICAAAFRPRNFAENGVHNRYMGLGYYVSLLDRFYDEPAQVAALAREAEALTRRITLETAGFLDEAMRIVERADGDPDRIEREASHLGLRIAEADRVQHARLDEVYAVLNGFAASAPRPEIRANPRLLRLVRRVAQGASVGAWLASCVIGGQGCDSRSVAPDSGTDIMVLDPPPVDMGDTMILDPLPEDMGQDILIVDPLPADMGQDNMIIDPPPIDATVVDMLPPDAGVQLMPDTDLVDAVAGQWRDTAPVRVRRSSDLPLWAPPGVRLRASRVEQGVEVALEGGPAAVSLRWQSDGRIEGEGRRVLWIPGSAMDQISVGVRSRGGIAVVSMRLKDVV